MNAKIRRVIFCSLALPWLAAGTVSAQTTSEGADASDTSTPVETVRTEVDGITTVIVTAKHYVPEGSVSANKSDIPLIETPQSVSVITRDQMDLLNFIDSQQAVRYTAGVHGENYGPDLRYDFLTVRGFTPKQYIDGLAAPISTTIYSVGLDLYAFESFDLLKGPASVLYGNAPPGGIYNQTTRRASDRAGGEIGLKYGEDDYKQVFGTWTGPVGDAVSVRFTGLYRDRDAERDLVSAKRALAAPTFTWKIGPNTSLTGLLYYQHDEVKGDTNGFLPVYGTLLPNPIGRVDPGVNLGDPNNLYKRRQYAVGWDFVHQFNEAVTFHSNLKWGKYRERSPTVIYGGGGLINTTDASQASYFRTVQQFNFSYAEDVDSLATDNRFDFGFASGSVEHKMVAGVDYRKVDNVAAFGFIFANTIDLFDPVYAPQATLEPGYPFNFNDESLKQTGVYVQDQMKFGDLYLLAGGRYDSVKIDNNLAAPATSTDQHKFTYRVGLNYVAENGVAPYVSYATSFEPVLGSDSVTGEDFKPSSGKQIEAGVKFDARGLGDDVRLFATVAAFKIIQTNVVSTLPSITPVFGTQSGEVEVKGGELEFVARLHEQLSINGSYSYTKSEVTKSGTPEEIGSPLPTTPKNKWSLFGDYTFQRGQLAGFGFGLGVRYNSESAGALPGPFNPVVYFGESVTLFDAIAHYDTPDWRVALNGSNITNKEYTARCSGPAGCTYGAGRQVILTATRKF
ncbi:MAG: TonB-dependent siderophore receptor [Steroidobacteraceae bacterium]